MEKQSIQTKIKLKEQVITNFMERIFISAKLKEQLSKEKISEISKKLPQKIAIVYSIQYKKQALEIKKIFSKDKDILLFSQVLGCSVPNFPEEIQSILVISSGEFHASSIANTIGKPTYVFDLHKIRKISQEQVEKEQARKKTSYLNFLHANNIGLLVSLKPGQENINYSVKIKSELENKFPDKKFYIFISNNINTEEFENFPDINSWINTACPRMDLDYENAGKIINISDLLDYMKSN